MRGWAGCRPPGMGPCRHTCVQKTMSGKNRLRMTRVCTLQKDMRGLGRLPSAGVGALHAHICFKAWGETHRHHEMGIMSVSKHEGMGPCTHKCASKHERNNIVIMSYKQCPYQIMREWGPARTLQNRRENTVIMRWESCLYHTPDTYILRTSRQAEAEKRLEDR